MENKQLEDSVKIGASAWIESTYYADAEHWLHVFWDETTIFYRLFQSLDLTNALELACGHARHAEQIINRIGTLTLMDVHVENIEASKKRLGECANLRFIVNNGYDFQPVKSDSITAIYCYDAMVHFQPDVVESYVRDSARVLQKGGKALYHHSNYNAPGSQHAKNPDVRNHMTEDLFKSYAASAGLNVVESVPIRWGLHENLDRVSLLSKP
jgi:ubiquinone/menaquinone biosynthesis C-methylase UbiE